MTTTKKTTVAIRFHDGTKIETEVENYNAQEMADALTNDSRNILAIGEVIVHRSNVATIIPVKS